MKFDPQENARRQSARRQAALKALGVNLPAELATLPPSHPYVGLFNEAAGRFLEPMASGVTPRSLLDAAQRAQRGLDGLIAQIPDQVMLKGFGKASIACKPGCNYCCSMRLTVSAPIVLALAARLMRSLSEAELTSLRKKVTAHLESTEQLSLADQLVNAGLCPLNADGFCSAYEARPITCRTYHSLDVSKCEADWRTKPAEPSIPQIEFRMDLGWMVEAGMSAVLDALRLDSRRLEFMPALAIALGNETAADRYLKGEDVFGVAYRPDLMEAQRGMSSRNKLTNLIQ